MPACAKDLTKYADFPKLAGVRSSVYESIVTETATLKTMLVGSHGEGLAAEGAYLCNTRKPQLAAVRVLVDNAEEMMEKERSSLNVSRLSSHSSGRPGKFGSLLRVPAGRGD